MSNLIYKILILLTLCNTFLLGEEVAVITKNNGNIKYKKFSANLFKNKVNPGMELFNQDLLSTGNDGFVMFAYLDDGSLIKVHRNSRVFVNGEVKNNTINKDIIIEDGFIKFNINKQNQNEFKVVTPTSVASVKGTVFYLDSNKKRDIFYGLEGIVEVLNIESNDISNLTTNKKITSTPDGVLTIEDIQYIQQIQKESGLESDEIEDSNFYDDGSGDNNNSDNDIGSDESSVQEIVINFTNESGEQKKLIIKYINE